MSTLAPSTRAEQHALCAQLIAAGLAPGVPEQLDNTGRYWFIEDKNDVPGWSIWRPWCDIQAVWHLVIRFGLSIGPCPTEHATSPRDTWRVAHIEASLNCADAGDIPYIVCAVALALAANEKGLPL